MALQGNFKQTKKGWVAKLKPKGVKDPDKTNYRDKLYKSTDPIRTIKGKGGIRYDDFDSQINYE